MWPRGTMVRAEGKRSAGRYWAIVFVAFVAAFVVGLAVAYLSVWVMGGQVGEIEGTGKYVSIIVSLACACSAYNGWRYPLQGGSVVFPRISLIPAYPGGILGFIWQPRPASIRCPFDLKTAVTVALPPDNGGPAHCTDGHSIGNPAFRCEGPSTKHSTAEFRAIERLPAVNTTGPVPCQTGSLEDRSGAPTR